MLARQIAEGNIGDSSLIRIGSCLLRADLLDVLLDFLGILLLESLHDFEMPLALRLVVQSRIKLVKLVMDFLVFGIQFQGLPENLECLLKVPCADVAFPQEEIGFCHLGICSEANFKVRYGLLKLFLTG